MNRTFLSFIMLFALCAACASSAKKEQSAGPQKGEQVEPAEKGRDPKSRDTQVQNPGEMSLSAVNVVRRAAGIFVYKYKETLDTFDPRKDYESIRRVTNPQVIADIRKQMSENSEYKQQYVSRCLPVWDYGLEFRDGETKKTFLFSFRCNTLKLVEERLYRDFSPERAALYALFQFEINEKSSVEGK